MRGIGRVGWVPCWYVGMLVSEFVCRSNGGCVNDLGVITFVILGLGECWV